MPRLYTGTLSQEGGAQCPVSILIRKSSLYHWDHSWQMKAQLRIEGCLTKPARTQCEGPSINMLQMKTNPTKRLGIIWSCTRHSTWFLVLSCDQHPPVFLCVTTAKPSCSQLLPPYPSLVPADQSATAGSLSCSDGPGLAPWLFEVGISW